MAKLAVTLLLDDIVKFVHGVVEPEQSPLQPVKVKAGDIAAAFRVRTVPVEKE